MERNRNHRRHLRDDVLRPRLARHFVTDGCPYAAHHVHLSSPTAGMPQDIVPHGALPAVPCFPGPLEESAAGCLPAPPARPRRGRSCRGIRRGHGLAGAAGRGPIRLRCGRRPCFPAARAAAGRTAGAGDAAREPAVRDRRAAASRRLGPGLLTGGRHRLADAAGIGHEAPVAAPQLPRAGRRDRAAGHGAGAVTVGRHRGAAVDFDPHRQEAPRPAVLRQTGDHPLPRPVVRPRAISCDRLPAGRGAAQAMPPATSRSARRA